MNDFVYNLDAPEHLTDLACTLARARGSFTYPDGFVDRPSALPGSVIADRPLTLSQHEEERAFDAECQAHEIACERRAEAYWEERGYWDAQQQDHVEAQRGCWA